MCRTMAFHKRVLRSLGNGPTRRNLFGPVDREQLQQDYNMALKEDLEEASRRWGFNFVTEKPLDDGDFLWEGISGSKVPLVYRSSTPSKGLSCSSTNGRASTSSSSLSSSPSSSAGVSTETRASTSFTAAAGGEAAPGMSQSGKENVPGTPERKANSLRNLERTPEKRNGRSNMLKRKQTNITDFYQAKRRVVATPRKSGQ